MIYPQDRHEPLAAAPWSEQRARDGIERIVSMTESSFSPQGWWPPHPMDDAKRAEPMYLMYCGAAGVIWALRYLESEGAVQLRNDYRPHLPRLLELNRADFGDEAKPPFGAYLMGDTPIRMLQHWYEPRYDIAAEIAALIEGTIDNPTRELMWGSPGTMLAALFMFRRTGDEQFAKLYRDTAHKLWSQLEWSDEHQCHFWSQDMYGEHTNYIDGVHGFVATATPLIHGRGLLAPGEWDRWRDCIANTIVRTAEHEGDLVNWRARLSSPRGGNKLVQYCHGAPGFVVCLGSFPDASLDDLLRRGAELTWHAGPLRKGSNLCHGTGGNGYAFLKMFKRTGDELWLDRARAFAMHAVAQCEEALQEWGRPRHSLWTGDPGLAIYLLDCIRGGDTFPTIDTFFG